jgi:2-haloacid dehalogenase
MSSTSEGARARPGGQVQGVLLDLLMAVMDSLTVWSVAARDPGRGAAWRDAVTASMIRSGSYTPYEELVAAGARALDLPSRATSDLLDAWSGMRPWPDSRAIAAIGVPYAFVTNSSTALARIATDRSALQPTALVTAEDVGWYKPHPRIYEAACQVLGVPRRNVLYIAGSAFDAAGARQAGLRVVYVARRADQQVDDPTIRTVRTMRELTTSFDR